MPNKETRKSIKDLREFYNKTQVEVAEILGVQVRRYQNWEKKNKDDKYFYIKAKLSELDDPNFLLKI